MDFGGRNLKDTLRQILANLAPVPENNPLNAAIIDLLNEEEVQAVPYTYSAVYSVAGGANALAAGVINSPSNVGIQADADFLILNQTYDANTANAARTDATRVVPNVTVLLTDTGSGFQMMDQAVPVPAIFGTGEQPYVLPKPRLMPAKSTLNILATNFDAAAGYNLRLCFNGVKLYRRNRP